MGNTIELSTLEFDILWEHFRLGQFPPVLRLSQHGTTRAERADLTAKAWESLAERDLGWPSAPDGRLGFRLRLLARPEWELDARLHLSARDRRTSALIAAKDSTAVVAVRHADRLTLRTAPADRMSAEALALLPPHHAGTGPSITLPADTIDAAAARAGSDPGMLVRALESRGLGRSEARKIDDVAGSIVRLGHFGAARTRRSETRRRASHVVSVYDSPSGRYLFTRKPSGRHTWITLVPGTDPAITRQLDELLAELDRS